MANTIIYSKQTTNRPAMNHTLPISQFTADSTAEKLGKIKSIVYDFKFKYNGTTSIISCTSYVSIIDKDNNEYRGTSSTFTVPKGSVGALVSLTIPEEKCPPASVIESGDFSIKLTTVDHTSNDHDPYVEEGSTMTLTVNYGGNCTAYVYNGTKWVPATAYVYNGTKWVIADPYVHNGSSFD